MQFQASPSDATKVALEQFLRGAMVAANALAKLHQSGIIHQNIRPENIRIESDGASVLLTGAESHHAPAPAAMERPIESLPYIAPEQTGRVDSTIDHRVDLYSLGIVLYERWTKVLPFHADDALGWLHCHVARAPRPLVEAAPKTPAVVSGIVMRLLAKSPDERYQSARGLVHDLERCLEELSATGRIEPFPLGARDIWDKLRATSRMYGHDAELLALRAAIERVITSHGVEIVLVEGPAGIGKSALLREVQREASSERASFLWGKFEKHKRDIPYMTIGQAFGNLVRQILASPDAELADMRQRLLGALGGNGQLIVELVPQIELVIGPQPPLPSLAAVELSARLHVSFSNFLRVLAEERPIVLVLDDLQWADHASLDLLQHILAQPGLRNLLVIGSRRDDEASQPLDAALGALQAAGTSVTSISIGPMTQANVIDLVVDLFHCDRAEAEPLAALLWAKTGGNPFFTGELLGTLHEEQLIRFDPRQWAWRWNISEIGAREISDDMVELVLGRLRRLPEATLEVIKFAACAGSELSFDHLAILCGKNPEQIRADLEPAFTDGILLQRPNGCRFLHERLIQAAHSLIPPEKRTEMHLRLGWLLLEHTPEAELDSMVFDIVNQLNLGAGRIETLEERRRVAALDLRAGRKAKGAAAARSAVTYLTAGLSLLPADGGWEADYALAYGLHVELAECEFLCGRFQDAERLCTAVLERAQSHVEKAAAYRIRIQIATAQVNNARAVEDGLACLRILGIELPAKPSDEDVLAGIAWVQEYLRSHSIEELIDLPEMKDPNTIAVMESLSALYPPAVYIEPNLAQVVIATMVRLSILHGNTPASVHGYVTLGSTLCSRLGAFADGERLGHLGWQLGQRPGFASHLAEGAGIYAATIRAWARPARESIDYLRKGFMLSLDAGKPIYAASNLLQIAMLLFETGEPLDAVYEATLSAVEFATTTKLAYLVDFVVAIQRCVLALRGDTARPDTLSGDGFDENAHEQHLRERNIPISGLWYHIYKLETRYLARDFVGAEAASKEAGALLWSSIHVLLEAGYTYYSALVAAARHDEAAETDKARHCAELSAHEEKLRGWAESCPGNFAGKHALISAEIARITGRENDAAMLYDRAIRAAQENRIVQDEAVACELAGRFYLERSFALLPAAYFKQARASFVRWGALAKVRQLDTLFPDLLAEPRRESTPVQTNEAEPIDTLTAARASEAISSEMGPEKLLATLMRILIEHAGAQRSYLLLPSPEGLILAAEITSGSEGVRVEVPKSRRTPAVAEVPMAIAQYVRRTREKLILDDVAALSMFTGDPYLANVHPRSILCAPIVRRGEVAGILYLENRLVRGAFTPRRLALLEFLSAVSLENALLAADLARETAERSQAERTLKQSEERLHRLVETANVVPWEADDTTGQFKYVGPQVVRMLGYPQEAWYEEGFLAAHVDPEDRESTLLHLVARSEEVDFDFRMRAADGRTIWLHNVVSTGQSDRNGQIGGFLFDVTERKESEATLKEKLRIIEMQQTAIQRLSTPIIEVWKGVLTMPVLGVVDEQRAEQMMSVVLDRVSSTACQYMIIDVTGVETVDTRTADHLMKIVRAITLLGAQSIMVGIRPEVAQTIVEMGVDLSSIRTLANLREALVLCMRDQRVSRAR